MREIIFHIFSASSVTDPAQFSHKITDELISAKLEPQKVTGVDYYQQESRNTKITFMNDFSNFIQTNIINEIKEINDSSIFFYYLVRILEDGNIIFTGWIKRDSIKYDRKQEKISLTASDVISVIKETGQNKYILDEDLTRTPGQWFQTVLYELLNSYPSFNIPYDQNFTPETGFWIDGLNININNTPHFPNDWANYWDAGNNSFWGLPSGWGFQGTEDQSNWNPYNVVNLSICVTSGVPRLTLMRYYKNKYTNDGDYWIRERLAMRSCKFTENGVPYSFTSYIIDNETQDGSEAQQTIDYNSELAYNDYLDDNFPSENSYSVTGFDEFDSQIYFFQHDDDPLIIKFDGYVVFSEITVKAGEHTFLSLLKMLLLMNNLTLKSSVTGSVEVINKTYNFGETTIDDDDVLDFSQSAVLRKTPNYESDLTPLLDNIETISEALIEYYNVYIPKYEYQIEIVNNYTLTLNQKIIVLEKEMYIVSIEKDKDGFSYKLKGWSI